MEPDDSTIVPFSSIENAQEYLALLLETIGVVKEAVENDTYLLGPGSEGEASLRVLQIVRYSLKKLEHHIKLRHRILNDLRTLRRLLDQKSSVQLPVVAAEVAIPALMCEYSEVTK